MFRPCKFDAELVTVWEYDDGAECSESNNSSAGVVPQQHPKSPLCCLFTHKSAHLTHKFQSEVHSKTPGACGLLEWHWLLPLRKKSITSKKFSSVNDKTICMQLHLHAGRDSSVDMVSSLDSAVDSDESVPLVKMCGITTVHDAVLAAEAGAKFIGMILWPKSKRSVSLNVAKEISKAAREHGAAPVGVFVEEDANEIEQACDATNIAFVQLHGDRARSALSNLVQHHRIIYVLHADKDGKLLTKPPNCESSDLVDWLLIDSLQGGSGKKFDWEKFRVPTDASKYGWLLAGGVDPENVSQAISILRPDAVDVSSGICAPDGIQKDPSRIASFMNAVRRKR